MLEVLLGVGILDVEVDGDQGSVVVVLENISSADFPSVIILFSVLAPRKAGSKLLVLDGLGLRVLFAAFRERLFIVPNLVCQAGAVEEEEVGGDAGVRCEDAVGEADDGVEIKLLE